jgi:alpha-maltose-1-phosphate synthase
MSAKLVGVIGSGQIGRNPFDRLSWSGISYFFFKECQRQGILHRAFGAEVGIIRRALLLGRNFSSTRRLWRTRFYIDPCYREALTEVVRHKLEPDDFEHYFLQIGAMYNVPKLLENRRPCFSYNDGNMAQLLRSPYAVPGLTTKQIDEGLAFEKEVYGRLRMIFPMSEYLRESFINDFGVPAERVKCIGAGVNLETLPEYLPDKNYDTKEILFIGVDFPRKGGWQLLEAFKIVREKHPTAKLHIVGPRQLQIPSGLERGVVYHGFLRKDDPRAGEKLELFFRRCSLFVMPSLYEPFGIAPLEAMVHQLPCLLTNGWALKEMAIPGKTGELCECGSVEDISAKLGQMLADPGALNRMGEAARKHVLEYYTWPKVVSRLKAAIEVVGHAAV